MAVILVYAKRKEWSAALIKINVLFRNMAAAALPNLYWWGRPSPSPSTRTTLFEKRAKEYRTVITQTKARPAGFEIAEVLRRLEDSYVSDNYFTDFAATLPALTKDENDVIRHSLEVAVPKQNTAKEIASGASGIVYMGTYPDKSGRPKVYKKIPIVGSSENDIDMKIREIFLEAWLQTVLGNDADFGHEVCKIEGLYREYRDERKKGALKNVGAVAAKAGPSYLEDEDEDEDYEDSEGEDEGPNIVTSPRIARIDPKEVADLRVGEARGGAGWPGGGNIAVRGTTSRRGVAPKAGSITITLYIIMEAAGGSIKGYMNAKAGGPDSIINLRVMEPIYKKLRNLLYHLNTRYGFYHRDLHQGNILIDQATGNFKLIDFGRCVIGTHDSSSTYRSKVYDGTLGLEPDKPYSSYDLLLFFVSMYETYNKRLAPDHAKYILNIINGPPIPGESTILEVIIKNKKPGSLFWSVYPYCASLYSFEEQGQIFANDNLKLQLLAGGYRHHRKTRRNVRKNRQTKKQRSRH